MGVVLPWNQLQQAGASLIALVAPRQWPRQVTDVLSSNEATITGKQLPPYPQFEGVIKENASDSKAGWPPRGPRRGRLPT
jgi:hypothetical protein